MYVSAGHGQLRVVGCWAGQFQSCPPHHPLICLLDCICVLCLHLMQAPGLGLQAPAEALRSRGKQVLGLAECCVRRPERQWWRPSPGHGAEGRPPGLSTAASFALDFLGFFPSLPNLSSRGTSSYQ